MYTIFRILDSKTKKKKKKKSSSSTSMYYTFTLLTPLINSSETTCFTPRPFDQLQKSSLKRKQKEKKKNRQKKLPISSPPISSLTRRKSISNSHAIAIVTGVQETDRVGKTERRVQQISSQRLSRILA